MSAIDRAPLETVLKQRRQRLAELFPYPVLLWSGQSSARNFPANVFPFRASSHFLYFAGLPLENAVIRLQSGNLALFWDEAAPESTLWHGSTPSRSTIAQIMGADTAYPLSQLTHPTEKVATILVQDATTRAQQCHLLGRNLAQTTSLEGLDRELAQAIVQLRLTQDGAALTELRKAAAVTVKAHQAGMAATRQAGLEAAVRAAMERVIMAENMTCAYASIVTVEGEVLHNNEYHHSLRSGDLLLADVGAETPGGWAADVTRTWPVSGRFSSTQRDLYEVVLAAHDACIAAIRPGVEYLDIHALACQTIAEGLVSLGILRGQPQDLVDQDAHALFFPHGVGHLLGLDVHDMEDLGDLAGYAEGRNRSDRFGWKYLRLNRTLQPGMVVTIKPGFYQVPALLHDVAHQTRYRQQINWERLSKFSDVRGIRIEDDVLVTETGSEVLTAALPTTAAAIEQQVQPR